MSIKVTGSVTISQGKLSVSPSPATGPTDPEFSNVKLLVGFNGNFNDESNSNHTPTTAGSVTTSATNAFFSSNQVGQYPGSTVDTNYVEYPISSDFRLEQTEDWTIECFARLEDTATNVYRTPLWFWDDVVLTADPTLAATARGFGFFFARPSAGGFWAFRYIANDVIRYTINGPVVSVNTWYYLAVVNDGATKTAEFFVDAISQGTGVGDTTGLGTDIVCSVGRNRTTFTTATDRDWDGQIEEVRVTRAKRSITGIPSEPFPRS